MLEAIRFLPVMPSIEALSNQQPMILGFDPGRDKCGIAVMGVDRQIRYHQVIEAKDVIQTIEKLCDAYPISLLVFGNQTTSEEWHTKLLQQLSAALRLVSVDERYSTLEARDRYWKMYPPKGFYKLMPKGMRSPPRAIDDIVAIILIERYLNRLVSEP